MFTALGQIFGPTPPRQAEHADTRQEIHRHDPEFERRKKKQRDTDEEEQQGEGTIIATEALLVFLTTFIKNNPATETPGAAHAPQEAPEQTQTPAAAAPQPAQSSSAAQAASAYQQTAGARKNDTLLETTDIGAQGPTLDLSAADVRSMIGLVEDLKRLREAKVEYIKLERAETFLQSLINAVNTAKSYLD